MASNLYFDNMEPRRLVQAVSNGKSNSFTIRALGPDGGDVGVVEGAQGVEDVTGLAAARPVNRDMYSSKQMIPSRSPAWAAM